MQFLDWKIVGESWRTTGHGESRREIKIQAEGCPVGIIITDGSSYCTGKQQDVIAGYVVLALRLAETIKK